MLATFFGGQFLALHFSEILQLFFTHRSRHLPGSAFERCSGAFATICGEAAPAAICCFLDFAGIFRFRKK
jgi:hypothetical protein